MIVIDKTDAAFAPLAYYNRRQDGGYMTGIVKRRYAIKHDGTVEAYPKDRQPAVDGDITYGDDLGQSVRYPSDIPDYKPLVDVVVNGHACAPRDQTVERLTPAIEVAGRRKELAVFGDRVWELARDGTWYITEPEPFARMPLRWEKSFGSIYDMRNPSGKGGDADPLSDPNDPEYPLPNIEDPAALIRDPWDSPEPVNFGAIPPWWQPRDRKYGTRDMFWATFRAPKLPRDHDARYHNAAPDDQQFEWLAGNETIVCENMDPDQPTRRVQLPGLRPRLFYVPRDDPARDLREVPMGFDTVIVDLDAGELTLVWRGSFTHPYNVVDEDIAYTYLNEEPVDRPPVSRERYQELFEQEIPQYEKAFEVLNISGDGVHEQIFGPIVEQAVKTLTELGADEALIKEVKETKNADELFEFAKNQSKKMEKEIRAMLDEIGGTS
jgi:hypothetical protein